MIVPAFNEGAVLSQVLQELLASGYSVVVVDDGSNPSLRSRVAVTDRLHFIRHRVNLGQGAAIQTGIQFALQKNATILVTFDADGQHLAADIPLLVSALREKNVDVALGSRFITAGLHNASRGRRFVLNIARVVNYLFTGLYLSDAHNGLRGMTANAAARIHLHENRMAHASEILLQIHRQKMKFCEVPTRVHYSDYSKQKGQSAFQSIRILFDLALHKLFE